MRVLVTGGSGFLGNSLLPALVKDGHEVIALSRNGKPAVEVLREISWEKSDLLDPLATSEMLNSIRPEGLLHLAWDTSPGTYWNSSQNLRWTGASLYLFEAFAQCGGKRLVVAGTSAEYQWGGEGILDEATTFLVPDSLYGISKNALREIVERWSVINNVSWSWGRIFNVFGPGEKKERLIPRVIVSLLNNEPISFDNGLLYRDFLHIEDAGNAFAALFNSDVQGPVNIASGEPVSIRQLLESITELTGTPGLIRFVDNTDRPEEPQTVVASINRLKHEVSWSPADSFYNRLKATCDWWKENI